MTFTKAFEKRCCQVMEPMHFLANMTDPRYYGQELTSKQEAQGETWLTEHYPQFLPGLLLFKIKDNSAFPAVMFSEDLVRQFIVAKWW